MAGGVAGVFGDLDDADFFGSEGPAGGEGSISVGVPAGDDASACGRAGGVGRVEAIHAEAGGGHFVEDGSFEVRVAVVGGFVPAVVVTHAEDDVGEVGGV